MEARDRFVEWVAELEGEGWTRTRIAQRLGVNSSVISKISANPERSVSLPLAVAIEREAGIPVEAWVSGEAA